MRIALACPYAWDAPGGVQVHVRQLAGHLGRRGHDVLVLAPAAGRPAEPWVTVVGRPTRVPYQGTVAPICLSPASVGRVAAALRSFAPDVVHAHEPLVPSTSMAATWRARAPVVATFHAYAERSGLLDAAAPALRPVWRRLAARIAVSEAAAGFVRSRFGDGIQVIPNGCEVGAFEGAPPAAGLPAGRRLLWVNRLDRQKGFPVAVAAFGRLAAEFEDLVLVVAGEGRDQTALDRLPPGARERVHLLGTVPHERLPGLYAAASVFLAPALGQESFGMVLVEAMAGGAAVVASDIAGYREVVRHEREGLLVTPGDPPALAAAVRRLVLDPRLAERLRGAGHERAQRYRWETVVGELEAVYGLAVRGR